MDIFTAYEDPTIPEESGTVFYEITESDLLKFYDKSDNGIMRFIVDRDGFDAFDLEQLYGSELFDDHLLYLCVTDGADIEINGEDVFPEEALAKYTPDDLFAYIKPGNDGIIRRYLSEYELKTYDINDVAFDMIHDGYPDFTEIVKWAEELGWLD